MISRMRWYSSGLSPWLAISSSVIFGSVLMLQGPHLLCIARLLGGDGAKGKPEGGICARKGRKKGALCQLAAAAGLVMRHWRRSEMPLRKKRGRAKARPKSNREVKLIK